MHLKLSSAEVVCCKLLPNITDELSIEANSVGPEQNAPIEANSVGPEQNAPIGAVCSGSTLFASILNSSVKLGNQLQQTTSAVDIFKCIFFLGALRFNKFSNDMYPNRWFFFFNFCHSATIDTIKTLLHVVTFFTNSFKPEQALIWIQLFDTLVVFAFFKETNSSRLSISYITSCTCSLQ